MTIGIPQALSYYYFNPFWGTFFEKIGFRVTTSGPTNRQKLDAGIKVTPGEACLPLKCYFGHVLSLMEEVDYIFVPRLVCMRQTPGIRLGCPKLIGLPDMVRAIVPQVHVMTLDIDLRIQSEESSYVHLARKFGCSYRTSVHAFEQAKEQYAFQHKSQTMKSVSACETNGKPLVGLLGHAYLLYDQYLNTNLINRIQESGVIVLNCHELPEKELEKACEHVNPLSWYFEEHILGAAYVFCHMPNLSGIIYLLSFGCGAGSITHEAIDYEVAATHKIPFLKIVLDEHTGETGLLTRIESFMDMIKLREKNPR